MAYRNSSKEDLSKIPWRIFLDSSTLQTLQDYGDFIYDGGEIPSYDRIWSIPYGPDNVDALRNIMFVGKRAMFELVISKNSLKEVMYRGRYDYLQWALEMLDYWERCLAKYEDSPFSGQGLEMAARMLMDKFGYLSHKDKILIKDAVLLECGAFLTIDRKLSKNATHIEKELGIKIMQPRNYWESLRPWAALFV